MVEELVNEKEMATELDNDDVEMSGEANYEAAVERVKAQIAEKQNNPTLQVIGEFILNHLASNARHSTQFIAEDKTLSKCFDTLVRYASQFRTGNAAVLSDEKVFAVVLNYYGYWEGEPFDLPEEHKYTPPVRTTVQTSPIRNTTAVRPLGPKSKPVPPEQMTLFDI